MDTDLINRELICELGRRLYQRGLCSGFDGNLSMRVGGDRFLCTPTGHCKGFLQPELICEVDSSGTQVSGRHQRTSELLLHLEIYAHCPDVMGVVHCHPPHASAWAVSERQWPRGLLAEAEYLLGEVQVAPYVLPGTMEFARSVVPFLASSRAVLLANHGAVTFGTTLELAWAVAESLENTARIAWLASGLGNVRTLAEPEIRALRSAGQLI